MPTFLAITALALGFVTGADTDRQTPGRDQICYACFWSDPAQKAATVDQLKRLQPGDPLITADLRYILWRTTQSPDCAVLDLYADLAHREKDPQRRLTAAAIGAFGSPECKQDGKSALLRAGTAAEELGRNAEAKILRAASDPNFKPQFADVEIHGTLAIPPNATSFILGESSIEIASGHRLGTQVERVARDWLSRELNWDFKSGPLAREAVLNYHEGALARRIADAAPITIVPLTGTLVAFNNGRWYAPDENGVFRFQVLDDKMQYPTTHAANGLGWIEDTHGVSAIVSQAMQQKVNTVLACGDTLGKAKASLYLAQKGVNVITAGDRFSSMLLGYAAPGVILPTAPVKKVGDRTVVGNQPVRFSLAETIVVEETTQRGVLQYYDAPARYFRRLSTFVPLKLEFVEIENTNQIDRVLRRANDLGASAVAVRVFTEQEYAALRKWLDGSPKRRAVLAHSGLYPFAQVLFEQYPAQVTFGDLRPRFE